MLNIAYAVIRKYYNDKNREENFNMSLQRDRTDRDYLYGRLLACAQITEHWAQSLNKENGYHDTNAERFMSAFQSHPFTVWGTLYSRLRPYADKLSASKKTAGGMAALNKEIQEIITSFRHSADGKSEFELNRPLSPLYILGYEEQLWDHWAHCKKTSDYIDSENVETPVADIDTDNKENEKENN